MKKKLLAAAVLAGFASMELEIIGTRLLSPVFGPTIYVWISLIAATLTFLSLGYYFGGRKADAGEVKEEHLGKILLLVGVYIALLPLISRQFLLLFYKLDVLFGPLVSSYTILSIPMFFIGFIVPVCVKLITKSVKTVGSSVGKVYFLSSMGSIAGTVITGFYLLFFLGVKETCLVTGAVFMLVSFFFLKKNKKMFFFVLFLLIWALFSQENVKDNLVVEKSDGLTGQILLLRTYFREIPTYHIATDLLPQAYYDIADYMDMHTYVLMSPFFYNKDIEEVLFVGLAGGITTNEILKLTTANMDVVEIEPKMVDIAKKYSNLSSEARIYIDDGRHFIRTTDKKYDLIIMDLCWAFSSWSLLTKEAFLEIRDKLNPEGLLLLVITSKLNGGKESYLFQSVFKSLRTAFPNNIILSSSGLGAINIYIISSKGEIDVGFFKKQFFSNALNLNIDTFNLDTSNINLMSGNSLEINDNIPLNTDNFPIAQLYSIWVLPKFRDNIIHNRGVYKISHFLP